MGFEDDLKAETRAKQSCKIADAKEKMDATDRKVLDAAMDNRDKIPTEVIIRALNKDPDIPTIGRKATLKHREGRCSCFDSVRS